VIRYYLILDIILKNKIGKLYIPRNDCVFLMFEKFFSHRENDQVLGAFLFINKIQETDYGQYMCSISNTDDQIVQQFTNITKPGKFYF